MQGSSMGGKAVPSAHHAARWRRWVFVPLVAGAGLLLGVGILVAWSGTGSMRPSVMYSALSAKLRPPLQPPAPPFLLTDDARFRPGEISFTWVPREERKELEVEAGEDVVAEVVRGEGVADCDLIVEGYEMQVFEDKAAAHACLRNKSIVLVGDSLTRYQYVNLVNFIENGQWGGPDPQLENEFQWGGWSPFYEGTNARFNGREVCDCYREEPASRRGNIENRYYYNEESDVWVTFFQWFRGETGHLGHDLAWLNVSLPPSRSQRTPSRRGKPRKEGRKKEEKEEKEEKEQQQQQQQQRTPALRPVPLPTPPSNPPAATPAAAATAAVGAAAGSAAAAAPPPSPALDDEAEEASAEAATTEAAAAAAADINPPRARHLLPHREQAGCLPGACNQAAAATAAAAAEPQPAKAQAQHHHPPPRTRQLLPGREQAGCTPGACDQPPDWEYDIYDFFTHIVPKLHPDILIINSGHWARLPGEYDLPRLSKVAREAVRASGGRVIWKTTTAPKEPAAFEPEGDLKEYFQSEGFSILDAGAITYAARAVDTHLNETQKTHLYWDMLHFYAPVYAGLNKVLLNYICPV